MLLLISFMHLSLVGWQCITKCLFMQKYQAEYPQLWRFVKNCHALGKTGVAINCSVNFIFYCFSGTNFSQELVQVFSFTKDHRAKVYSVKLVRGSSPVAVSNGCENDAKCQGFDTNSSFNTNRASLMNPTIL